MWLFLKNLLFTVVVPGTVAVYLPFSLVSDASPGDMPGPSAARCLALLPIAGGAAVYLWCLWDFARFGRGTPAPIDAPKKLVIRGLYRFVRNPMYVGVLSVVLGWALYFASLRLLLYAAAVGTMFQLFVLLYEEPRLRKVFGRDYERYLSEVGRWRPRLGRRK